MALGVGGGSKEEFRVASGVKPGNDSNNELLDTMAQEK